MDSTPAPAPPRAATPARWVRALLVVAFAGYAIFLARHVGAYAGNSDSSGYLNSARLLSQGEATTPQRVPAGLDYTQFDGFAFTPLGFRPLPEAKMAPTYPIGLPLLLAATAAVTGWSSAPPLVMLASALAAVALMIPLGRAAGLPFAWSVFGALVFAAGPLTTFMSIQLMSDIPATAAVTAAVLCAWRSRAQPRWAVFAGVVFAVAVLIRPNNFLLLIPLALCLGLDGRRWLGFTLGGLPGAVLQLAYNRAAYGHPLASGYGEGLVQSFTFGIVPTTLAHYARWLPVLLTPVGLAAIALPWLGRRSRFAWVLVAWIAVTFGFYAAYWHTHETWWYLRFLLPAFPACLVAGLLVLRQGWLRLAPTRLQPPLVARSIAAAAALVVLGHSALWHQRLDATLIGDGESVYPEAAAWTRAHVPADAILVAQQTSGALFYSTRLPVARWDSLTASDFARLTAVGRPIFAVLFPHEIPTALGPRLPGRWEKFGAVRHVTVWRWSPVP